MGGVAQVALGYVMLAAVLVGVGYLRRNEPAPTVAELEAELAEQTES